MVDPKNNNSNNEDLIEALKTDEEEIEKESRSLEAKAKFKKMIFLIVIVVILLIILLWLMSLSGSKKKGYEEVEKVMVTAGEKYFNANKSLLPTTDRATSEVSVQKLVNGGYMKSLDSYSSKAASCSGKVVVENNDDTYLYVAYLDCGSNYSTTELFREITKSSNVVDSDEGLYKVGDEYIFKGENVKNYVKLDDSENIWRIVKVDKNDDVVLIYDGLYWINHYWDDRYNNELSMNYGYNTYKKSRIKDYLADVYNASKKGDTSNYTTLLLNDTSIKYLTSYNLCVGKRNEDQTQNNNLFECQEVIENTKLGLLTLSDYISASLDPSCKTANDVSCQNYNFISIRDSFWLVTGTSANSYGVYMVDRSGTIEAVPAGSYSGVRPVIHLSNKTMFASGKGTKDNPYLLK